VTSNDPDAVAEAIQMLLEDPERRERMGKDAVSYIDEQHRWPILGTHVAEVIRKVC